MQIVVFLMHRLKSFKQHCKPPRGRLQVLELQTFVIKGLVTHLLNSLDVNLLLIAKKKKILFVCFIATQSVALMVEGGSVALMVGGGKMFCFRYTDRKKSFVNRNRNSPN